MNETQSSRPKNIALEEILKNRGFSEFLITAWGIIELNLNNVILREFNMSTTNPEYIKLLKPDFSKKLSYQLELGMISKEEKETIQAFKKKRNDFFHDQGVFISHIEEGQKQEIADKAFKAVDITEKLCIRVFDGTNNQRWVDNAKKTKS